jgi:hypothetical protein
MSTESANIKMQMESAKGEGMKKTLLIAISVMLLAGCVTGPQVQPVWNMPCTIYTDFGANPENSIIARHVQNPCAAQKLLATAAKLPAIWAQQKYIEQFNKWAGTIHQVIAAGTTYAALQNLIISEVAKFNTEAGMALLILSDSLLVFGQETDMILPMDKKLLLASLNDLRVQVAALSLVGLK